MTTNNYEAITLIAANGYSYDLSDYSECEQLEADLRRDVLGQADRVSLVKQLNDYLGTSHKSIGQKKDNVIAVITDEAYSIHNKLTAKHADDIEKENQRLIEARERWEKEIISEWEDMNIEEQIELVEFEKNPTKLDVIMDHLKYPYAVDCSIEIKKEIVEWLLEKHEIEYGGGDINATATVDNDDENTTLALQTVVTETETEVVVEQVTVNDEIIEVTTDSKYEIRRVNNGKWIDFIDYQGNKLETVRIGEANKYVKIPSKKMLKTEFIAKNQPKPAKEPVRIPTAEEFVRSKIPCAVTIIGLSDATILYHDDNWICSIDKDKNIEQLMPYNKFALKAVTAMAKTNFSMAKFLGLKQSNNTKQSRSNNGSSGYPTADKPSSQKFLQLALAATRNNGHFTLENDVIPQTGWAYSNARNYLSYVKTWQGYTLENLGDRKYRLTKDAVSAVF